MAMVSALKQGHAGATPHGLMPGLSRSSQDSVAAKTTANTSHHVPIAKEARQVELAGFLRGYSRGPWGLSAIAERIQSCG